MKRTRSVIPIILATVLCLTAVSPAMGAETAALNSISADAEAADETAALNSITAEAVAEETDIQDIQMEPDVANIQIVTEDAETQMEIEKSDVREEAEKLLELTGPEQISDKPPADEIYAQEEERELTEITEPEQAEEDREAVADNVTGESVAQAIWTEKNTTLTFYYGPQVSANDSFNGEIVTDVWSGTDVTDSENGPQWNYQIKQSVTCVVFDAGFLAVKPKTTRQWFYECVFLNNIDLGGLDTSNVTDMNSMFCNCESLTSLDVSGFDTSNVTDMYMMFYGCRNLTSLDVSGFDTSNVTDMSEMFGDCYDLTSLDVSRFDTSNVTNMNAMFELCTKLKSLDVSGFDTSNVKYMGDMFNYCESLSSLDLSGFDTSNVIYIDRMFCYCRGLTSLDLSSFDTSNVVSMENIFAACESLTSLDVSSFDTSGLTDMSFMFAGLTNLTSLDVSGFDTSNVTSMFRMFDGCANLTSLDVSGFDTSNVTFMFRMFGGCANLTSLDVSGFDMSNVTDISYMFDHCSKLKTIYCKDSKTNWSKRNGENVFFGCDELIGADGDAQIAFNFNSVDSSKAKSASLRGYFSTKGSVPKIFIQNCDSWLSSNCLVYTGKRRIPTVFVEYGSKPLVEHKDYELRFENCVDVGTASAIITGKGDYTGTVTLKYLIKVGKTSRGDMFNLAGNVKVTWKEVPGAKYYKVYREGITNPEESLKEPVIVTTGLVGWDKEPGLTNGNAYRYKIVASTTGRGDPIGDSRLFYTKVMYRLKTVVIRSVKNTEPGAVTVKYDKTTSGDSYVLQYCERQDMVGAKTKVVLGANNTSYTISGLQKGKTYYISIRVRKKVDGIDYYTTFGVPKKITVIK